MSRSVFHAAGYGAIQFFIEKPESSWQQLQTKFGEILPVASIPAHKHQVSKNYDGPLPVYEGLLLVDGKTFRVYTGIFKLTGYPVVTVPIDVAGTIYQLLVNVGGDTELLAIARQLSAAAWIQ